MMQQSHWDPSRVPDLPLASLSRKRWLLDGISASVQPGRVSKKRLERFQQQAVQNRVEIQLGGPLARKRVPWRKHRWGQAAAKRSSKRLLFDIEKACPAFRINRAKILEVAH